MRAVISEVAKIGNGYFVAVMWAHNGKPRHCVARVSWDYSLDDGGKWRGGVEVSHERGDALPEDVRESVIEQLEG